jgi:hypothetical protein
MVTSKAASLVQISGTSLLLISTRPCIKNTVTRLKPNFINQRYLLLSSNMKLLGDERELQALDCVLDAFNPLTPNDL